MIQYRLTATARCALISLPLLIGGLSGCQAPDGTRSVGPLKIYRMEVVQGNVVTREAWSRMRVGLLRDQVRMLLGSPLITDAFHQDRWDYAFTLHRPGSALKQYRVTVYFSQDKVTQFDEADLPSEQEFVASIDTAKPDPLNRSLEMTTAEIAGLPVPKVVAETRPAAAGSASAPMRDYPPLESSNLRNSTR
jgi:outer membrane protein assembly factor BamE